MVQMERAGVFLTQNKINNSKPKLYCCTYIWCKENIPECDVARVNQQHFSFDPV